MQIQFHNELAQIEASQVQDGMPVDTWKREETEWLAKVFSQDFRNTAYNPYVAAENLGEPIIAIMLCGSLILVVLQLLLRTRSCDDSTRRLQLY